MQFFLFLWAAVVVIGYVASNIKRFVSGNYCLRWSRRQKKKTWFDWLLSLVGVISGLIFYRYVPRQLALNTLLPVGIILLTTEFIFAVLTYQKDKEKFSTLLLSLAGPFVAYLLVILVLVFT